MVALAALREWRPVRSAAGSGAARSDHARCRTGGSSRPTPTFWGNARATLVLITLADAQAFNEILRVLGHARSDAFIRAGAARLIDILGPGHLDLPRQHPELRLPPAGPCRARSAGDDRPDRRGLPRADPLRRRADRHPHRHRPQGPRRPRQPGRGPARHPVGGAGQPQRAQRLGLVRPQERRGAPPRLPPALRSQARARRRGPARAALPAQGHARHRRLRQRRGAAALDPSRSSGRSRPASSSSWPRRPRSSPR